MTSSAHPPAEEFDLVEVLSALGNPVRMGIVRALAAKGEHAWGELDVSVAKSTLSQHLKLLRAAGITRTREEGLRCFVSLRREDLDHRFPGLLDAVVGPELDPPEQKHPGKSRRGPSLARTDPNA